MALKHPRQDKTESSKRYFGFKPKNKFSSITCPALDLAHFYSMH